MSYAIEVDNIKCGGCAGTIMKRLAGLQGVAAIDVDVEKGIVRVDGDASTRSAASALLESLGYPESGSTSGMASAKARAKSFVSCAVGRFGDNSTDA